MNLGDLAGGDGKGFMDELMKQLNSEDSVIRAQLNDQRLTKLAEYEVTHGYMDTKVTADQLQAKFADFKNLVRKGDFTLKSLEDDVYSRWGIQEESRENLVPETGTESKPITGFSFDEMDVAEMDDNDERNH